MSAAVSARRVWAFFLVACGAALLVTSGLVKSSVGQLALAAPERVWAAAAAAPPNPYVSLCLSVKGEHNAARPLRALVAPPLPRCPTECVHCSVTAESARLVAAEVVASHLCHTST